MERRDSKRQGVAITEVGILRFRRRVTAAADVDLPFDEVRRAVGACLPLLLSGSSLGSQMPEADRVRVGLASWMPKVTVEPEVSSTARARSGAAGHIHWHAVRYRWLFPEMEADVFVHPVSPGRTRLVLDSDYQPPGGMIGIAGDLLVGRLVARSTLAAFTARLRRTMEEAAKEGRCGPGFGPGSMSGFGPGSTEEAA